MKHLTLTQQKAAAKAFAKRWEGIGDEKQDCQRFWTDLLISVYGIENPADFLQFEVPVKVNGHQKYKDVVIPSTHVLIEQKGIKVKDLNQKIRQSEGDMLTPYEQAQRYADNTNKDERPTWIITSNFQEFWIYDQNKMHEEPEKILLKNLEKSFSRLNFLVKDSDKMIKDEMEVSIQAGEIVGRLYDAFYNQMAKYMDMKTPEHLKILNKLCVRIVFCLYAEDAGLFGEKNMFHDYLKSYNTENMHEGLHELFKILDLKEEERAPYIFSKAVTQGFPYVNGGLFEGDVPVPPFNEEMRNLLLEHASEDFDWSQISPTIFGAVFESTLNPETRRKGGMHYTSLENIHKVIDPLFLDELKEEFYNIIEKSKSKPDQKRRLESFQNKLASLKFFDPAAGSGNFLTETYISLRLLENKVINELQGGLITLGGIYNPIKVSIQQFYGIEINDFAVTVAKTALWIAESQMFEQTKELVNMDIDFLPLKSYTNIIEGNALELNWHNVLPSHEAFAVMGNPPFLGYSHQSEKQKNDLLSVYVDEEGKPYNKAGKIDYVAGWYFKASEYIHGTRVKVAFVSTNSITQGEQVADIWEPLMKRFNIHIDFAYKTFQWDSESNNKAHVHCVIIGFSNAPSSKLKTLYDGKTAYKVAHINPYLFPAKDVFIHSRTKPLCNVYKVTSGNRPADGGALIIEGDDYEEFIKKEPGAVPYIRKFMGAEEYINRKPRYCLWLVDASPSTIKSLPMVAKRVEMCREDRLKGASDRKKLAETPTLFRETKNPSNFIIIPRHSSFNRKYVPMGYLGKDVIVNDAVLIIPNASLFHFGVLISNVHMAWMRAVCGRLKSDYRYSANVVYNNFPWPDCTESQKEEIEKTASQILAVRDKFPNDTLAALYDVKYMPRELINAHNANNKAVMKAYGFWGRLNDEDSCTVELMNMYEELIAKGV